MRVLFVGDITGPLGVSLLCERLPELRREHRVDVVVANGENAADDGMGLSLPQLQALLEAGVDVLTGGNHSWDPPDAAEALAHPRVVRPLNVQDSLPGQGAVTIAVGDERLTVVNLIERDALNGPDDPVEPTDPLVALAGVEGDAPTLVDLHFEHVFTKQVFAHAVAGRVSAVLGTHTHEPSLFCRILPGGTAYVSEVGMTGSYEGVMGFEAGPFVREFIAGDHQAWDAAEAAGPSTGTPLLGAVVVELEGAAATSIERVT